MFTRCSQSRINSMRSHRLCHRLAVERLEERAVPATISIADATAIEGSSTYRFTDSFVAADGYGLAASRAIQVGPDGNVYVASHDTDVVKVFESGTGRFLRDLSTQGGELDGPWGMTFGTDGRLYVGGRYSHDIIRFNIANGSSETFVTPNSGGLGNVPGLTFGPDGNLYATSGLEGGALTRTIKQFSGVTGTYLSDFVILGSGSQDTANGIAFGPDGNLYVASGGSQVKRYNGQTGAFIDSFVTSGSGGLVTPGQLVFRGDGYLYVSDQSSPTVYRYSATTGAFVDVFAASPVGIQATGLAFASSGELYISQGVPTTLSGSSVGRFAPLSFAGFTVSLDVAAPSQVTVEFSAASGTALSGSDFTATNGTLTFAPGQTTGTILVRTLDDTLSEGPETFTVNLTNAVGAAISDAQAVGTIIDNEPSAPQVNSTTINGGATQRSRVTSLAITFNAQVTFAGPIANAFTLTRNGGGPVSFSASASVINGVTVVTLNNFTGPEAQSGSLRDGRYTLMAIASQISANGQQMASNYTFGDADGLFRYYGDMNGDRRVDISDLGFFSLAFLQAPNYNAALDFNNDGRIDIADFGQFSVRFFTTLP